MATVNDATFSQVLSAPLAVVDFWNPRCPHCVAYKPTFEEVAAQMASKVFMVTANTDETQQNAAKYNLTGVPTTIFLMNGKEVYRASGNMSKDDLLRQMSQALNMAEAEIKAGASEPVGDVVMGGVALAAVVGGLAYLVTEVL